MLAEQKDISYIETMFLYLCEAKDSKFREGLLQEFQTKLQPILGEDFMTTIADSFRQEGRQEGREKGRQEGIEKGIHLNKLATAHEMLIKGLDETMIAEITKLSLSEIRDEAKKLKSKKQTHH